MATQTVIFTTPVCNFCGNTAEVELTLAEAEAVKNTRYIQDALPNRDADFRELFISGTHAHCWESMFGGEDDEEEDELTEEEIQRMIDNDFAVDQELRDQDASIEQARLDAVEDERESDADRL